MNMSAIVGGVVALGLVLMGIMIGSKAIIFFDVISAILVFFGMLAFLLQAHGTTGVGIVVKGSRAWLAGDVLDWERSDLEYAASVSGSGAQGVMLVGWVTAMIGLVQILQYTGPANLETLGPACAVMVLSVFYALVFKLVFWLPLGRWLRAHAEQVRDEAT